MAISQKPLTFEEIKLKLTKPVFSFSPQTSFGSMAKCYAQSNKHYPKKSESINKKTPQSKIL